MREIIILKQSLLHIFPKPHKMHVHMYILHTIHCLQEWVQGWITNILKRMSCMLKTIVHGNIMQML